MNKKEAAAQLGLTVRALEYHMTAGRIASRKIQGARGKVADFAAADVERLARYLATQNAARPEIVMADNGAESEAAKAAQTSPENLALSKAAKGSQTLPANLAQLAGVLRDAIGPVGVPLVDKLTLTESEAAQLSGLPEKLLRANREKLGTKRIGPHRSFVLRRDKLADFVRAQFGE